MKGKSLKSILLGAVAALLGIAIVVTGIHLGMTIANGLAAVKGSNEEYELYFTADAVIQDEDYHIVLRGNNGEFCVDANNMKDILGGTYASTEGQGWTFFFADSLGSNIRSHFDQNTKQHSFLYPLDMGSRGSGVIQLKASDTAFQQKSPEWKDIPTFSGSVNLGVITADMRLICKADGTFSCFSSNFGQYIPEITGTYEFSGDDLTFTAEGETYAASLTDGLYVVTVPISLPVMGVSGIPGELVQDVLLVN